jgi:hypothetical protein
VSNTHSPGSGYIGLCCRGKEQRSYPCSCQNVSAKFLDLRNVQNWKSKQLMVYSCQSPRVTPGMRRVPVASHMALVNWEQSSRASYWVLYSNTGFMLLIIRATYCKGKHNLRAFCVLNERGREGRALSMSDYDTGDITVAVFSASRMRTILVKTTPHACEHTYFLPPTER